MLNKIKSLFSSTKKVEKTPQKKELGFFPTLALALLCAGFIRSFFFEPFHIPSSSMKPNLLIGDYIFVAKYSYGYSRYSFPFGLNLFEGRFWQKENPKRGDVAVFRLPSDPRINYVKRIIGLPGDKIQMRQGHLYINGAEIEKNSDGFFEDSDGALITKIPQFLEKISDEKTIKTLDQIDGAPQDDTGIYEVPEGFYFMMGDNRDNSQDSRFLSEVGYVPQENLVGRATIIFCSTAKPLWQFWHWPSAIRFNRIFDKVS